MCEDISLVAQTCFNIQMVNELNLYYQMGHGQTTLRIYHAMLKISSKFPIFTFCTRRAARRASPPDEWPDGWPDGRPDGWPNFPPDGQPVCQSDGPRRQQCNKIFEQISDFDPLHPTAARRRPDRPILQGHFVSNFFAKETPN